MKRVALSAPPVQTERAEGSPWTMDEAAAFLRLSVSTLVRMEKAGTLRVFRPHKRNVLITDEEVRRIANGIELTKGIA
ncbi:helix-turn-helix domain-containing protein [Limnoglobus roseus]|uniref:DNA-binding protein n=1 Tax=Limnoglobus roseus TaxID=2598579 RepID=A0A5C1A6X0_9BACT|nr:helix-turn-helix domain-containing protein [Limnoglobus roseus]QEL14135.1 DNA-binding protein [Limnoglobus roseus]